MLTPRFKFVEVVGDSVSYPLIKVEQVLKCYRLSRLSVVKGQHGDGGGAKPKMLAKCGGVGPLT